MNLRQHFADGFSQLFVQKDYCYQGYDSSRLTYAKNSLKKLVLMPIYLPLSIIRMVVEVIGLIFHGMVALFLSCCNKDACTYCIYRLGGITGALARLAWTPIRMTYLFFRSLYGAIINPEDLTFTKDWERRFFQIENNQWQDWQTTNIVFSCFHDDYITLEVPPYLKYEV